MTDEAWDTSERVSSTNFDVPVPITIAPKRRNPLAIVLSGALLLALCALAAVTFSLVIVSRANTNLQGQLTCRSASAVVVDESTSQELSSIGQAQATTLEALAAIQVGDQASLETAISLVPQLVSQLQATSKALDAAVAAREDSLTTCK